MQHPAKALDVSLSGLRAHDWLARLEGIVRTQGRFERLGPRHVSALIERGDTLLVTFETIRGIRSLDARACPLGWEMVRTLGWSHLAMISDGDTWFRDDAVHAHVDRLSDDGILDGFDRVLFHGAGSCGYAAAAFSVAAPGATVVAIQPQATLDPGIAGWDDRFVAQRRRDFTTRYGYAPDMIDACERGFILYDPCERLDAMHAALFARSRVTRLPLRRMGSAIQARLAEMGLLSRMLAQAVRGELTRPGFARLMRARRDHQPYLGDLLARLDADGRHGLAERLCRNVTRRMDAPGFAWRLKELEKVRG